MTKKYTYFFGAGYTSLSGQAATTPGAIGSQSEITSLYDNGVFHIAFGDISGAQYVNFGVPAGDAANDELLLDSGSLQNTLIWDEFTTTNGIGGSPHNLYGVNHVIPATAADGRYGLPGGGTDQVAAIDIIRMATDPFYNASTNLINLGYNAAYGGLAYNTAVTIFGGPGRELVIAGEGNDIVYGGDDHSTIGEGIWGGGGADTIYAGANTGQIVDPAGSPNTGADDLFGYSGDDVMYGANDGDVYYGDIGNDIIFGAGFAGVGTIGSGYNGDQVTFFGGDGNDTLFASANVGSNGVTQTREFFIGGDPQNTWIDKNFVQNADGNDTGTMDVVSYQNAATAISANIAAGGTYFAGGNGAAIPNNSQVGTGAGGAVGDIYFGIEGIIGGTQGDTLIGSDGGVLGNGTTIYGGNFFSGLGGNDTLFGAGGNDTLFGGITDVAGTDGNNTLFGGAGLDSITGGGGNDLIIGNADVTPGGNTTGWDGVTGSSGIVLALGGRYQTQDSIAGGAGTDTFNMSTGGDTTNTTGAYYAGYSGATQMFSGVEIIIASAGADVLNLTNGSNAAVSDNVSIFAGNGGDVVFSGSGSDLIVGDSTAGGVGADTLFGGAGNDLVWGDLQNDITGTTGLGDLIYGGLGNDSLFSAAGDDTIYGGAGNDTIDGGAGNDRIFDSDAVSIMGGDGADIINADFTNAALVGTIVGGLNAGSDLADTVFTTGSYTSVTSNLGLGNDTFIGSAAVTGTDTDTVDGQDGNDVLSTWSGPDVLFGGIGNDVAWGGAGNDTVYGGDGTDYLYGGGTTGGGTNVMYGGLGEDYFYVSRNDGINQIFDQDRIANANTDPTVNYLVIYGEFNFADTTGSGGQPIDYLANGEGVFETDHNFTNNDINSMIRLTNTGDLITLSVIHGVGAGTTTITFDDRDISQIVLWNNDATAGTNVLQYYSVDLINHTYTFTA